jgi:uncharacterized membrane protein YhhN
VKLSKFWIGTASVGAAGFLAGLFLQNELLMQLTRILPHLALLAWWWSETRAVEFAPSSQNSLPPRFWLLLGLVACTAADFVIRRPQGFISGIYGFLLAQVAFITAFTRMKGDLRFPTALPFLGYAVFLVAALWPSLGAFQGPVVVYAGVIALMGWRAWVTESPTLRLGAFLFMSSDSMLAIEKFAAPTEGDYAFLRTPVILTYWGALYLLLKQPKTQAKT